MGKVKYTTTIDADLLHWAKAKAEQDGLPGGNAVIEAALRQYVATCATQVWEKPLSGGWLKKLTVRPERAVVESIRSRRTRRAPASPVSEAAMHARGWRKVWPKPA